MTTATATPYHLDNEVAAQLGYQVAQHDTPRGKFWFTAPAGTRITTTYGRQFATETDALLEVEGRVCHRLQCTPEELYLHLGALLGGPEVVNPCEECGRTVTPPGTPVGTFVPLVCGACYDAAEAAACSR